MTNTVHHIPDLIEQLGRAFGPLDNEIAKWENQTEKLQSFFPGLEAALQHHFAAGSLPVAALQGGIRRYFELLAEVDAADAPPEVTAAAVGFLNLRMFLLLNAFLLAVAASLQSEAYIDQAHAIKKIARSDYAPYFFERLRMTTPEVIAMLQADLAQLQAAPPGKRARLLAARLRSGIHATLAEEYCPERPLVYYALMQLNNINHTDGDQMLPSVIQAVGDLLAALDRYYGG